MREDPELEFCTSDLVKLELIPKAAFFKQTIEVAFYEKHFSTIRKIDRLGPELGRAADSLGRKYGLAAMDALHLASAIRLDAEEFITTEKSSKAMFRVKEIKVVNFEEMGV